MITSEPCGGSVGAVACAVAAAGEGAAASAPADGTAGGLLGDTEAARGVGRLGHRHSRPEHQTGDNKKAHP